jgi:hypothetical protein
MISRASVAKAKRGGEHPYVAVVDGAEISFMRFGTRAAALAYAERVASLQQPAPPDAHVVGNRSKDLREATQAGRGQKTSRPTGGARSQASTSAR